MRYGSGAIKVGLDCYVESNVLVILEDLVILNFTDDLGNKIAKTAK